jgi:hypothetical protein
MIPFLLALASVTIQPPAPQVGDLITVQFAAPVTLEKSADFELVRQSGNVAVVRTFAPKPFAIHGTAGAERFTITVPVQSVLKQGDDLKPAPLAPPRPVPYPRLPFVAIAIAALCAVMAWIAVWLRSRKRAEAIVPAMSADERFRRAVLALRTSPSTRRWATLADETRAYLAATRPRLGKELTTSEMLPRLAEEERVVEEILRQGDLEKFSPRGTGDGDFAHVIEGALALVVIPSASEGPGREVGR